MNDIAKNSNDDLIASDDLNQILLDTMPICGNCWNDEYKIVLCNQETVRLFGLSSKQDYCDRFFELSPQYQPNGELSKELAMRHINKAFETGYMRFEWLHQKLDGEPIPAEITLVRTNYNGRYIVTGYTRDLREIKANLLKMREADERTQIMLDATPLCSNFWDKNFVNIDCNQEAVKLFDLSNKEEYLERFFELSPEYQPNGRSSAEMANEFVVTAFDKGYCKFEWLHQKLNGEPIPSEITLVRVKYKGDFIVVGYTRDLRELKATMAKIREADERTQLMLDATPLCCNLWNRDFNNIDCNQEAVKLFELSSKKEYLDRFFELSPEYQPCGRLSQEMAVENITKAFEEGYCRFEWMHKKLNGEPVPSEITLVRVKHRDGFIIAGYTRDLRELKATMAEMREADERTQLMLDATPLCCNLWNRDFNNIDCNQEAVKLFELSNKKEYLDRFFELSPEYQPCGRLSKEMAVENITKAFEEGYCRFEWMHKKLDGEPLPSEITLVRVKHRGEFIISGYTRDLRELKAMLSEMHKVEADLRLARDAAEAGMKAKNEFLSGMSHEMRTPMIVTNDKAEVEYISNSSFAWLDLDARENALNRPLSDLFTSTEMKKMIQKVMETEGFVQENFELIINGEKQWFMLRSSQMGSNKNARVFEWVDITQLMDAKNEAELATRAKDEFLARMSHEIRTPMNAITGMSELILRENIPPVIREHALSIKQASANLLSIINDILDFSKIGSGKFEIVSSEYSLASLINDVTSIIRTKMTENPIQFVVNVDSSLPNRLIGDEIRLRQVLLNLLGNAVKYTNEGFVSILVEGSIEAEDTVLLKIEIADSGIGIKKEDIGKLFENFVQLDMIKNRGVQGTGLGLAISKNYCQAMGGDILVCSEYGVGSTFTVTIPQKFSEYEKFASVENPGDKSVLIYEPRSTYANSIALTMKNLGVHCDITDKQSKFHDKLKTNQYKFVFLASFLWESVKNISATLGIDTKLVLLTEFGEVLSAQNVMTLSMPAHPVSIANILNDVADNAGFNDNYEVDIRFIAPSARILIVDDINTNLKVVEGLMSPYKMMIDTCLNGLDAIEMVKINRYDIIFMDHMMPMMDGVEVTNIIRGIEDENNYYQKVPIIALTANAVSGVKEMFLKNGLNDFLAKPLEFSKLNSILEKWVPKEKKKKYTKEATVVTIPSDLQIEGIDVKTGILMTGGKIDDYLEILAVFYEDSSGKINEIRGYLAENNIKLYTICVHAIKSAAATIGAAKISEFAKRLEFAGNNDNVSFIIENTEKFIKELEIQLKNIAPVIMNYLSANEKENLSENFLHNELLKLKKAFEDTNASEIDRILNVIRAKTWGKKIDDVLEDIYINSLLAEYEMAIDFIEGLLAED